MATVRHKFLMSAQELALLVRLVAGDESLVGPLRRAEALPSGRWAVHLDMPGAERVRQCLTERLAVAGFGEDYSSTDEGEIIEGLIDRFYAA